MKRRKEHIKEHFQKEAGIFDERVVKIVPYYRDMLETVVAAMPFKRDKPIKVIDLGSGTGTVAYLVKKRFPKAEVKCIDMSQNMLDIAAQKLNGMNNVEFELAGIEKYVYNGKYDAIISSLALHHLNPGKGKKKIYKNIFGALNKGGVFIIADIIISADKNIQKIFINKWAEFILKSYTHKDVQKNYERYKKEDRPAVLENDLKMLKDVGFKKVETLWKYCNFAAYGGWKS